MRVLVIAPHPDDETLGCGGTLLRHKEKGDEIFWLIITDMKPEDGWKKELINERKKEIVKISKFYKFSNYLNLSLPSTKIDCIPNGEIVRKISNFYSKIEPQILYVPFAFDVHTDHQIISKAIQSTLKWFRHPYINQVFMYETLSETDFNYSTQENFKPNTYVDISKYIERKVEAMNIYKSEINDFPFPRSVKAINALAQLRGSQSGFEYAESFVKIFEKIC